MSLRTFDRPVRRAGAGSPNRTLLSRGGAEKKGREGKGREKKTSRKKILRLFQRASDARRNNRTEKVHNLQKLCSAKSSFAEASLDRPTCPR